MFERVETHKLQTVVETLSGVYAEKVEDMKLAQFARTLSLYARIELARREREVLEQAG